MGPGGVPAFRASGLPAVRSRPLHRPLSQCPARPGSLEGADPGTRGSASALGYRPIHVFLRREGWQVNHKRVYRLYTEEELTLKPRRKARRSKAAANRKAPALPTAANERWAMDFIHDTAYWNQVGADFTRPGKPVDNTFVEAFHGTFRRECLSQHWYNDLEEARRTIAPGRKTTTRRGRTAA